MARSKKRKFAGPMDPAEAARQAHERRRNPEKWGADREALKLPANAEVRLVVDASTRKLTGAQRYDVFSLFRGRRRGDGRPLLEGEGYSAARDLERDLEIRAGVGKADDIYNKSGGGGAPGSRELANDAAMQAGERVDFVLKAAGPMAAAVMTALLAPGAARENWRGLVGRVSGEYRAEKQGAVVVEACNRVAGGYVAWRRERAAQLGAIGAAVEEALEQVAA